MHFGTVSGGTVLLLKLLIFEPGVFQGNTSHLLAQQPSKGLSRTLYSKECLPLQGQQEARGAKTSEESRPSHVQ